MKTPALTMLCTGSLFFAACSGIETPIDRLRAAREPKPEFEYDPKAACIDQAYEPKPVIQHPEYVRYPDRRQYKGDTMPVIGEGPAEKDTAKL